MTKKVRIENADTSSHKVVVQTWARGVAGAPDTLVKEQELNTPADLCEAWVWQGQYVVIKEQEGAALAD
jgi:hypothetical protein